MKTLVQKAAFKRMALLFRTQEHPDIGFHLFSAVAPDKCWDNVLN
jgi:hypothetical protein